MQSSVGASNIALCHILWILWMPAKIVLQLALLPIPIKPTVDLIAQASRKTC